MTVPMNRYLNNVGIVGMNSAELFQMSDCTHDIYEIHLIVKNGMLTPEDHLMPEYLYVLEDPYRASDNNSGLTPDSPLLTGNEAFRRCYSGEYGIIFMRTE
jgi:hypothetical protein